MPSTPMHKTMIQLAVFDPLYFGDATPKPIPVCNLEECVRRQSYGTRFFILITFNIRSTKLLK